MKDLVESIASNVQQKKLKLVPITVACMKDLVGSIASNVQQKKFELVPIKVTCMKDLQSDQYL